MLFLGFCRRTLRYALGLLTTQTLKKHEPLLILVEGDESPTIVRQAIYCLLCSKYQTVRQNPEESTCEFCIPLSILGFLHYPKNIFSWLYVIIKTALQVIYLKPYKHVLVINMHFISQEIFDFWMKILSPNIIVTTGNTHLAGIERKSVHITLHNTEQSELLTGKLTTSLQKIAKIMDIELPKTNDFSFKNKICPEARIKIVPAKDNSVIVDARHIYHPIEIGSVIEVTEFIPGNKFIFTDEPNDISTIPNHIKIACSIKSINMKDGNVYIFRGQKDKYVSEIENLTINGFDT